MELKLKISMKNNYENVNIDIRQPLPVTSLCTLKLVHVIRLLDYLHNLGTENIKIRTQLFSHFYTYRL